jgi:hypothetical protein
LIFNGFRKKHPFYPSHRPLKPVLNHENHLIRRRPPFRLGGPNICWGDPDYALKAQRKLASYEVAGVSANKKIVPQGTTESSGHFSGVLSGRDGLRARVQPQCGWLISEAPSEQRARTVPRREFQASA